MYVPSMAPTLAYHTIFSLWDGAWHQGAPPTSANERFADDVNTLAAFVAGGGGGRK